MKKYLFPYGILIGFLIGLPCFSGEKYNISFQGYLPEYKAYDEQVRGLYYASILTSISIERSEDNSWDILFNHQKKFSVDYFPFTFEGERQSVVLDFILDEIERRRMTDSKSRGGRPFVVPLSFSGNSDSGFKRWIQNIQSFSKRADVKVLVGATSQFKFAKRPFSSASCFAPMMAAEETKLPPVPLPLPPPMPRFNKDPIMRAAEETKLPPVPLPLPPPMPRFFVPLGEVIADHPSDFAMMKFDNEWKSYYYTPPAEEEAYFMVWPSAVSVQEPFNSNWWFLEEVHEGQEREKGLATGVKEDDGGCDSKSIKELAGGFSEVKYAN